MRKPSLKSTSILAAALSLVAYSAQADILPVLNIDFNQLTNAFNPANSQKDFFNSVQPLDWSTGAAGVSGTLTYVGKQGSEGFTGGSGNVYPVYTDPGFSVTVPAGTNFFQADGNPAFEDTIFQTIAPGKVTAGTTYTLQFQQAAGQQVGFPGNTTEQWRVFLGVGGVTVNCPPNPCTVTAPNNEEQDSTIMNLTNPHNIDWNSVTLTFTPSPSDFKADGSIVLTFLAWGDGGSTNNLPPTLFLEGVNTAVVPEPASLALFGAAFFGFGTSWLRRGKRSTQA